MMERSTIKGKVTEFPAKVTLSQELFTRLSMFIYNICGIKMPPSKKTMLEARLIKRMRSLGFPSLQEYCGYLFSKEGETKEIENMIDAITTNKTDFFREAQHFEFLVAQAIPNLINSSGAGIRRTLMVWSAACSSGEETYTLAMVLEEFSKTRSGFDYMILGTDISTKMLGMAQKAIYDEERVIPVPFYLRQRYFLRSKDRDKREVRVIPELRAKVRFRWLNFMEEDFGFREKMDVIFCRNVLIYFDRPTQERVVRHLCKHLESGGYLFTGHSETLNGMNLPLQAVANTVSRRI